MEITSQQADLALFHTAVQAWAIRFTPRKIHRFALIMGRSADMTTHAHYRSFKKIGSTYRQYFKEDLSYSTLVRRLKMFEEAGVLSIERRKQGPGEEHPGAQASNLYTVNFSRVIVGTEVLDHDFYGAIGVEIDTRTMAPGLEVA